MQKVNTYKGYDLFNESEVAMVRAYNRVQTLVNIREAMGDDDCEGYLGCLDDVGKKEVALMARWIQREGTDNVVKYIANTVKPEQAKMEA